VLRRAVYRTHFVFASVAGALALLTVSLLGLLFVFFSRGDRRAPGHFSRLFSAVTLFFLGWRVEVEEAERLVNLRPAVFMPRHQSNLDVVTLGVIYPYDTVIIGKKELRKIPIFGWFFGATGNIFIDRQNQETAIASLREAAERVKRERLSVWVFPEGTRNTKRTLKQFKKGSFHLAIEAQLPIVPLVVSPIDTLLDEKCCLLRPGTIRVRVLPPIPTVGLVPEDVDRLVETVWKAMEEGARDLVEGAPPPIG
jgi:lysophosphatidate acyltransferase